MNSLNKSPCFGLPHPLSPACSVCSIKAECYEQDYNTSDMPVLIKPRLVPEVRLKGRTRYAVEKVGMKPWEQTTEGKNGEESKEVNTEE